MTSPLGFVIILGLGVVSGSITKVLQEQCKHPSNKRAALWSLLGLPVTAAAIYLSSQVEATDAIPPVVFSWICFIGACLLVPFLAWRALRSEGDSMNWINVKQGDETTRVPNMHPRDKRVSS